MFSRLHHLAGPCAAQPLVEDSRRLIFASSGAGTPVEADWDGLERLPEYRQEEIAQGLPRQDLTNVVPRLGKAGVQLLESLLQYDPKKRMSAVDSMAHSYFSCYGPRAAAYPPTRSILTLPTVNFVADAQHRPKKIPSGKGRRQSVAF